MPWCEEPASRFRADSRWFWGKVSWPGRLKITTALVLCAVTGGAQDDARDVLWRVRQSVMATVEGLPKYVCTQTIDRARYEPDPSRFVPDNAKHHVHSCDSLATEVNSPGWRRLLSSSDRLRLDVAVTHIRPGLDSEMYSWAGEDRFSDRDLFEMIRDGALSTGSFSAMLASVFGGEAATFSYNGDTTFGGRLLSEFGFRVPLEKSRYTYVLGSGETRQVTIEYGGTFLADPEKPDLVRLVVHASHLPEESSTCEITQTLNYSRTMLHGTEFLLPSEARIAAVHMDGTEAENVVHYSACHEFQGRSTVRFEKPTEAEVHAAGQEPVRAEFSLPSGLPFKLVFTERIDTKEAAAGDPIQGKLKTAIRDRSSRVLIPEGAEVTGRIVNIRHFYGPARPKSTSGRSNQAQRPSLIMKVKLEAVEVGGHSYPFKARYDAGLGRFEKVPSTVAKRIEIGSLDRVEDSEDGVFEFYDANPSGIATSGLESNWRTLAPAMNLPQN